MGAGVVLGVRLVSPRDQRDRSAEAIAGEGPPPSAVAVIMRSIDMMQARLDHEATGVATVTIMPEFEHVPADEAAQLRATAAAYFETGLEAAEAALPRIAAALPWLRP